METGRSSDGDAQGLLSEVRLLRSKRRNNLSSGLRGSPGAALSLSFQRDSNGCKMFLVSATVAAAFYTHLCYT